MAYKDKQKQVAAARRHYLKNKKAIKARALLSKTKARNRNKSFVAEYLKNQSCKDCGENEPIVLEFDHVRGKKSANIADLKNRAVSLKTLKKEIAKCDIRCANCHRKKTYWRRHGSRI